MSNLAALLALALLAGLPCAATAAEWGCHGTKPGHPTPAERLAFIREASDLAVKAEAKHGVPASALTALAIVESGYGWTRLALEANNFFAWKSAPSAAAGRKFFVSKCHSRAGGKNRFVIFASRADAFDFVAAKLASLPQYADHTKAYHAARKRGDPPDVAAKAWVAGIAKRYSGKPAAFANKLTRLMNDPTEPSDVVSAEHNLYRLSARASAAR